MIDMQKISPDQKSKIDIEIPPPPGLSLPIHNKNNNNNNSNINNIISNELLSSSPSSSLNTSIDIKKKYFKKVLYPNSLLIDGILQTCNIDNIQFSSNKSTSTSSLSSSSLSSSVGKNSIKSITTTTTTTKTSTNNDINNNNNRPLSISTEKEVDHIPFFSGNPNIEVTEGTVHLFLNTQLEKNVTSSLCLLPNSRTNIVCIESVPSYMTIPDLIGFLSQSSESISDMKIIRDASPNRYMVLLRFIDQCSADEFYQLYNGKNFSSFEPEACTLLFVSKVEYQTPSSNYLIMPPSNSLELPTCPVCLDRLDSSTTGIVTVLCHHTFHCDCLSKWKGDNTCPVCRYLQVPTVESNNVCSQCDSTESLWICIICGHVGCSRYVNSHANKHYEETMHTFSLELETQRVWDYAGDGYVHRLIQNRSDGKVLEFPNPAQNSDFREGSHLKEEKIESIVMEYNFLLASQLEQQRAYFEQYINKIEKENAKQQNQLKEEIEKANSKWSMKYSKLKQKGDDSEKEANFLKQINVAMKENQQKYLDKEEEMSKQIEDLSEELRDLRFFIEAQKSINDNNEIKDATIYINNNNTNTNNNSSGNKKSTKKKK